MSRARIETEKAIYVLLPNQHLPSGRAITSGQRAEIDAACNPLTECGAPVPIRHMTSINVIPCPLLPPSQTDNFIIVFAFGLWYVKHKSYTPHLMRGI